MDQKQLFTAMFQEDREGQKLLLVPGADELIEQFEQKFVATVHSMFEFGLKVGGRATHQSHNILLSRCQEKEIRDREIEDFWICVNEAKDENTRRAAAIIDEFKVFRVKLLVRPTPSPEKEHRHCPLPSVLAQGRFRSADCLACRRRRIRRGSHDPTR